jgi:hypothetical protein
MGAGVLAQLVIGNKQLDTFVNINPQISYFKYAYNRHTNFGLTTVRLDFINRPIFTNRDEKYRCNIIKSNYNILTDLYLKFTLPDIYSNDKYKFRWINNYSTLMIKRLDFVVNNTIIDSLTGEWLIISNELTEINKDNYNKLTGNLSNYLNPNLNIPIITINNNKFKNTYPIGDKSNNKQSIKGREIIIPLKLNFTKNPSLGFLLSKITGADNNVWIELILEDIENLYQVYSYDLDMYISPKYYNEITNESISIDTFVISKEINAYIEASYVILDNAELTSIIASPQIDILIEKIIISSDYSFSAGIDLGNELVLTNANTHLKEIIWTLKRDDYYKFNENTNYTNSIPEDNDKPIMSKARIMFNKTIERVSDKDFIYYNQLQPYKHHTSIPKQGIYCYSFAIFPESYKPSGSLSASGINTSLYIYTNTSDNSYINNKLSKIGKTPYNYTYRMNYYLRSMNLLRYINGTVGYLLAE